MSFITLADAKMHLNIDTPKFDTELTAWLDAACDVVETEAGPIALATFTDEFSFVNGRDRTDGASFIVLRDIALRQRPVQSLTSITTARAPIVTYDVATYTVETETGILRRLDRSAMPSTMLITYQAGYATPPAWAILAAKIILQHLWRTQRGSRASQSGGDANPVQGIGYLIPNQAAILMEPHRRMPAFG